MFGNSRQVWLWERGQREKGCLQGMKKDVCEGVVTELGHGS